MDADGGILQFLLSVFIEVHGFHDFRGTPAHSKSKQYIHLNNNIQWKMNSQATSKNLKDIIIKKIILLVLILILLIMSIII